MGINFHGDTGAFGGGNAILVSDATDALALPSGGSSGDFYHHKYGNDDPLEAANFDATNRYRIWHYMISGYNFDRDPTSSGFAGVGGDDSFISYGLLASTRSGSTLDNAVAGTVIHELGHNLCLSDTPVYTGQDSSCVSSSIDNVFASSNYKSAMNYTYQTSNDYSYSDGTNGTGDHNDLGAIAVGIGDFAWNDDDSSVGGPL